jgi:MraZ protein
VEIIDFFHGGILNAVDAKGRVSLPSTFRGVIDRRVRRDSSDAGSDDRLILLGEHAKLPCLEGFDPTYSRQLHENIRRKVAAMGDVDEMEAMDDEMAEAFGSKTQIAYDGAGRMVLSAPMRRTAGIADTALFVGGGETFQIWNPDTFRTARADKPRLIRMLDSLIAERAQK